MPNSDKLPRGPHEWRQYQYDTTHARKLMREAGDYPGLKRFNKTDWEEMKYRQKLGLTDAQEMAGVASGQLREEAEAKRKYAADLVERKNAKRSNGSLQDFRDAKAKRMKRQYNYPRP